MGTYTEVGERLASPTRSAEDDSVYFRGHRSHLRSTSGLQLLQTGILLLSNSWGTIDNDITIIHDENICDNISFFCLPLNMGGLTFGMMFPSPAPKSSATFAQLVALSISTFQKSYTYCAHCVEHPFGKKLKQEYVLTFVFI